MTTFGFLSVALAVAVVSFATALCPDGIAETTTVSMMKFSQAQFGQTYMWDCDLETEAMKSAKECSTANAGASERSFKFSLTMDPSSGSAASLVESHFSKTPESQSVKKEASTDISNIGCGFAECKERVDIVCLFKNYTTTI